MADDFDLRKKEHSRAFVLANPREVAAAFAAVPNCPLDLVEKLRRLRRLSRREVSKFDESKEMAEYQVRLPDGMIVSFGLGRTFDGRYSPRLATAELPRASAGDGNLYLAGWVAESFGSRGCRMSFPHLEIDCDSRNVLVTGHACQRLLQRAGIRGSACALVARSVERCQDTSSTVSGRQLRINDADGKVLGYAPVSEVTCSLCSNDASDGLVTCEQPRWLLKTFLTPEMVQVRGSTYSS